MCLLGKVEYEAPLTIARINNAENAWLFTERFGVDVPVSNTAIMAEVLQHVSLGEIVTLLRLKAENMVVDEIVLSAQSEAVGKRIAELSIPARSEVMAIVSDGPVVVPRGDTVLKAGDELLILAKCEDETALKAAFGARGWPRAGVGWAGRPDTARSSLPMGSH